MNLDFSFRIEIVLLIFIIFLIMTGHVVCSCCKMDMMEGFATLKNILNKPKGLNPVGYSDISTAAYASPFKEGFVSSNPSYTLNEGQSSNYDSTKIPINTNAWFTPDLSSKTGKDNGKGIQNILNRPKQQVPLPEGELSLFANTKFSQECCPNAYSNSSGCACMTVPQYNYLIERGGNNIPYSEY